MKIQSKLFLTSWKLGIGTLEEDSAGERFSPLTQSRPSLPARKPSMSTGGMSAIEKFRAAKKAETEAFLGPEDADDQVADTTVNRPLLSMKTPPPPKGRKVPIRIGKKKEEEEEDDEEEEEEQLPTKILPVRKSRKKPIVEEEEEDEEEDEEQGKEGDEEQGKEDGEEQAEEKSEDEDEDKSEGEGSSDGDETWRPDMEGKSDYQLKKERLERATKKQMDLLNKEVTSRDQVSGRTFEAINMKKAFLASLNEMSAEELDKLDMGEFSKKKVHFHEDSIPKETQF